MSSSAGSQADGYKLGDIFQELASGATNVTQRQKRPAKYRNPQNPEQAWSGIGADAEMGAGDTGRTGIDVAAFKGIPMYQIHA